MDNVNGLSIFIPFYNDAGTVEYMISSAHLYGGNLTADLEVIAINDGSVDNTLSELNKMKERYPDLKIVDHAFNKGYGGALISGINNTTKNWIFYTDGDAQYHLDDLSSLWDIRAENDVVNGVKLLRSDNQLRKLVGKAYARFVNLIFATPIIDIDCDYRLMKGDLVRSLNLKCTSGAITIELIKKLHSKTVKFEQVKVNHYNRVYGKSAFFTVTNILKTFKEEFGLLLELRRMRKLKK